MIDQCSRDPIWKNHYGVQTKTMVEKIRKLVIFTLKRAISSKQFDWKNADPENLQSSEQWMEKMSKNAEFCDHIFVQMTSDALCRDIIVEYTRKHTAEVAMRVA